MKLRDFIYNIPLLTLALVLTACNDISEDDRFTYVKPADVNRAVLLEDYTGQLCVNCPTATQEIERIVETYGDDAVIAVAIHSGPNGFEGFGDNIGLMTDTGNEYFNHWGISSQPAGIVNRSTGVMNYTDWATGVYSEISKNASLSMSINNAYDNDSRKLAIEVVSLGTNGSTKGKLQVWLVEDNIIAYQIMPDGTDNMNYVHNHVFRAAVNGTWGEDISLGEGESVVNTCSYVIPTDWKAENVSVVAFVYNDSGVQQVIKQTIINRDNE